jgi:tRNA-specific adenosine deaminase 1
MRGVREGEEQGKAEGEVSGRCEGGYRFKGLLVRGTRREFEFSRRRRENGGVEAGEGGQEVQLVPSNLAAAWTPYGDESLIGGVLQGRKQFDPRGASMICRKRMWELAAEVAAIVDVPDITRALRAGLYELVKASGLLEERRRVKAEVKEKALKGWVRNEGDDEFGLDVVSE